MIDQRCTYCDRPALAPGHVTPPLCAQHCEIVRIVLRLREQRQPVTINAIERLYASGVVITRFVAPEDLPDRLIEYLDGELARYKQLYLLADATVNLLSASLGRIEALNDKMIQQLAQLPATLRG